MFLRWQLGTYSCLQSDSVCDYHFIFVLCYFSCKSLEKLFLTALHRSGHSICSLCFHVFSPHPSVLSSAHMATSHGCLPPRSPTSAIFNSVLNPLLDLISISGKDHYFPPLFRKEDPDLWGRTTREANLQGDSSCPVLILPLQVQNHQKGCLCSIFTACGWPWLSGFTGTGGRNTKGGQWQPRFPWIFVRGEGQKHPMQGHSSYIGKSRICPLKSFIILLPNKLKVEKEIRSHLTHFSHCTKERTKAHSGWVAYLGPHRNYSRVKPSLEWEATVAPVTNSMVSFFLSYLTSFYKLLCSQTMYFWWGSSLSASLPCLWNLWLGLWMVKWLMLRECEFFQELIWIYDHGSCIGLTAGTHYTNIAVAEYYRHFVLAPLTVHCDKLAGDLRRGGWGTQAPSIPGDILTGSPAVYWQLRRVRERVKVHEGGWHALGLPTFQ